MPRSFHADLLQHCVGRRAGGRLGAVISAHSAPFLLRELGPQDYIGERGYAAVDNFLSFVQFTYFDQTGSRQQAAGMIS